MDDFLKDEPQEQTAPVEQVQETGEVAAPPAEAPKVEEDTRQKGLELAMLAERRKRQELEEQLRQFQQPKEQPKTQEGPPDPNAYQDNPQEYWRLLARYEARQELQGVIRESQEQQAKAAREREAMDRARKVNDIVTKGQLKYADFDPVINSGLAPFLTPQLHQELADSDAGHDLAYWLAKNPLEADRLSKLTGRSLTRELTRIEDRLTAPQKPSIPNTLTAHRDARGQFDSVQTGPTSLHDILGLKPD